MYRRSFLLSAGATVLLAGCDRATAERVSAAPARANRATSRGERIDAALSAATRFLRGRQAQDGAWRSDVYGPFKEGDALTPLALLALSEAPDAERNRAAIERATSYLAPMVQADGTVLAPRYGLAYPLYTAAGTLLAIAHQDDPKLAAVRDAWVGFLLERQLAEPLGWRPEDAMYGGWGYASQLPRRPPAGDPMPPLAEPNLSATVFALAALRAAGVAADDPAIKRATFFVSRCQNWAQGNAAGDPEFDDGGFFFMQHDPVRNKAGVAGTNRAGRERFISYGSTTADGLRALGLCGVAIDDPRVVAAWGWLAEHFAADTHPGAYTAEREAARQAVYFYYCQSLAQALSEARVEAMPPAVDRRRWAAALADALVARQRADGSWSNTAVDVREDDPLVATSLAARALTMCRGLVAKD